MGALVFAGALLLGFATLIALVLALSPPAVYDKDFIQEYLLAWSVRARDDPTLPNQ